MRSFLSLATMLLFAVSAQAQDATTPPSTQHALLTVQGQGVQIYTCKTNQWVFVAPAARLFDVSGIEVGSHGDGPVWHLQDGSSVLGKVIQKTPSPDKGSIPWLLLKSDGTDGAGKLVGVEFIRRSETHGGVAPSGQCDDGAFSRVPYSATYTFYSSK
jgi:Protein of unknown function (DUF3455)